jgi:hypothetical protein
MSGRSRMLQLWDGCEQKFLFSLFYFIAISARHGQAEVTPAEIATSVTSPPRVLCGKVSPKKTFGVGAWGWGPVAEAHVFICRRFTP